MNTTLKYYLIFSIFLLSQPIQSQNDYAVIYGQTWGFLKYFHPEPSKLDWDAVLINDYPRVKNCKSDEEINILINDLIIRCGKYKKKKRNIPDSLIFKESFAWIASSQISAANRTCILELLQNKPEFKNKYVRPADSGNPDFKGEKDFPTFENNQALYYLAVSRYMNAINYFNPNRIIYKRDWSDVYRQYIYTFDKIKSYEDYYFAISSMTAELRDGHGFLFTKNNPWETYRYAPFYCLKLKEGYFINYIFKDSTQQIKIKKGDQIITIDGVKVEERMNQIGELVSASNDYYEERMTHYLRLTPEDKMTITVLREGELISETLSTLDAATIDRIYSANLPKKTPEKTSHYFAIDSLSGLKYTYLDMGLLERKDINRSFKKTVLEKPYLIIDSRNYPNWTILKLSRFLIKGRTEFVEFRKMNFDYPGSYTWQDGQTIGNRFKGYTGKIYVLVDYMTMSQAEYTVMALQKHPNTVVIGGQTAGADGDISEIPLPFGIASVFSGLAVYYPDKVLAQQVGVRRDIEIIQDKTFLSDRCDLILEKALELMRDN